MFKIQISCTYLTSTVPNSWSMTDRCYGDSDVYDCKQTHFSYPAALHAIRVLPEWNPLSVEAANQCVQKLK